MKVILTDEEKETLSYDDVAYLIIKETKKKIKIQDLFKKVIDVMELPDSTFENGIGEFYELIVTDKRFIMLDGGFCDLKENHTAKIIIEEEDEDFDIQLEEDENEEEEILDDEDNYDAEANPDDNVDDDYQDLVIIDENSEELDTDIL